MDTLPQYRNLPELQVSADRPRIILAQPQAPYGPHVMTPGPLWVAGAQLLHADPTANISFQDENLRPLDTTEADIIGLNALGAPNFPAIQKIMRGLSPEQRTMLGGQVIQSLSAETRTQIFGTIINGNDLQALTQATGIDPLALPTPESTSLLPLYERIPDDDMRQYLTRKEGDELKAREFAFYLSQGCKFLCTFCAAVKKTPERYRDSNVMETDLRYLMQKSKSFGVDRLEMYISNLDLFQTPNKLLEFATILEKLKQESPGFTFGMRGLATTKSFVDCHHKHPNVAEAIAKAGLHTLGFGIDGTPAVWKRVKKGHNDENDNLLAVQLCSAYGVTPETLMIVGQPTETEEEMEAAFQITKKFAEEDGAATRPHVWKPLPGSDVWGNFANNEIMPQLLKDPDAFTSFDVLAAPSPVSHPDENVRHIVTSYFERYLALPSNRTAAVQPLGWWLTPKQREENKILNVGKVDR